MFTLSFHLRSGQKIDMLFQTESAAREIFDIWGAGALLVPIVSDHYGTEISFQPNENATVLCAVLQNMDLASEGAVEMSLLNARNQVRAQEKAMRDPMIQKANNVARSLASPLNGAAGMIIGRG